MPSLAHSEIIRLPLAPPDSDGLTVLYALSGDDFSAKDAYNALEELPRAT